MTTSLPLPLPLPLPSSLAHERDDAGLDVVADLRAQLADMLALGDERARALGALLARTEHAVRTAHALVDIIARINDSLDLDQRVAVIARYAGELLGGCGVRLGLIDGEDLVIVASAGVASDEKGWRAPLVGTVGGECVRLKRPFRSNTLSAERHRWLWTSSTCPPGVNNAVAAPLLHDGTPVGAIMVFGNAVRDFTADDEELLLALAHHAAIAIENARLYRACEESARLARAHADAEQHRGEREQLLATALESLEQPVLIGDADGLIRYANRATADVYGHAPAALVGQPLSILAAPAHRDAARHSKEQVHCRASGAEFPAAVTTTEIADPQGRVIGSVVVIRDVTDERRIAEQLRQSDKMVALGELVAGVAHEVNNPLTGISAFAQLLMDDPLDESQREAVGYIKREADRAAAVVRDLLSFSRKSGPRVSVVHLNATIEQTLRLRAYALRTNDIDVRLTLDPALHPVQGDERQLQQVLLNLIVNAEQALTAGTTRRLTITTVNVGRRVQVDVRDSGPGMPPDVRSRVFEPFFTTKPEGTGTGLGLSVSYGIVQSHGGMLTVDSAPGHGSVFRITLPAHGDVPPVSLFKPAANE